MNENHEVMDKASITINFPDGTAKRIVAEAVSVDVIEAGESSKNFMWTYHGLRFQFYDESNGHKYEFAMSKPDALDLKNG